MGGKGKGAVGGGCRGKESIGGFDIFMNEKQEGKFFSLVVDK